MKKLIVTVLLPMATLVMSQITWAEDTDPNTADTSTPPSKSTKMDASSPETLCKSMVEAAKNKDFKSIHQNMTHMGAMHANTAQMKKDFENMESQYMGRIRDISCGKETIAGNHAVVEADSKGEKRLIPFVMENGVWKFDSRVYVSLYPMHGMHGMHEMPKQSAGQAPQQPSNAPVHQPSESENEKSS